MRIRIASLACAVTLLASLPALALDEKYVGDEAKVNESTARARAAAQRGDGGTALDLYCDALKAGMALVDPRFTVEMSRLQAKRYGEFFTPPGNADSMYWAWKDGLGATFSGKGAVAWGDSPDSVTSVQRFGPRVDGPAYLVTTQRPDSVRIVVDFNLDGVPEIIFDGKEATIAAGLTSAVDRAPDGRRVQWLIAPPGGDPRRQAAVWIYRDGRLYGIIVDTDGDGAGNCGQGSFL